MIKPLKGYWVCEQDGMPILSTIKRLRKDSISELLEGSTLTWEYCKSIGFRCVRVNISFTEVKEG